MTWYCWISLAVLVIAMAGSVAWRVHRARAEAPPDPIHQMQNRLDIIFSGIKAGKSFEEVSLEMGYSPEHIKKMQELAEQAVKRQEEDDARYAKMTPEERAEEDKRRIQAGVDFIMDERLGGP